MHEKCEMDLRLIVKQVLPASGQEGFFFVFNCGHHAFEGRMSVEILNQDVVTEVAVEGLGLGRKLRGMICLESLDELQSKADGAEFILLEYTDSQSPALSVFVGRVEDLSGKRAGCVGNVFQSDSECLPVSKGLSDKFRIKPGRAKLEERI